MGNTRLLICDIHIRAHPIVWHDLFPAGVLASLISWENPTRKVASSDFELWVSVLCHVCMADCYYVRERNTLARTENTSGLWGHWKGYDTSTSPPAHLLILQAIHQRFNRYIPCHDFVRGVGNGISGCPHQSSDLTDTSLLAYMNSTYHQSLFW